MFGAIKEKVGCIVCMSAYNHKEVTGNGKLQDNLNDMKKRKSARKVSVVEDIKRKVG